jgi:hypothetical protein
MASPRPNQQVLLGARVRWLRMQSMCRDGERSVVARRGRHAGGISPMLKGGWARSGSLSKWTRSAKTPQRLPAILYELARTYAGIWYFCTPATQALIQRAIAELNPPTIRQKFSLVPLRLEGQRARRPTVSPAPPPLGAPGRGGA